MLAFLISVRLGYVGMVPNDIKNLYKNQEIEHKLITVGSLNFHDM